MKFATNDSTPNRGLDATKQALRGLQGFHKIFKQLSQRRLDNSPIPTFPLHPSEVGHG